MVGVGFGVVRILCGMFVKICYWCRCVGDAGLVVRLD
jgi:hypothetical protein